MIESLIHYLNNFICQFIQIKIILNKLLSQLVSFKQLCHSNHIPLFLVWSKKMILIYVCHNLMSVLNSLLNSWIWLKIFITKIKNVLHFVFGVDQFWICQIDLLTMSLAILWRTVIVGNHSLIANFIVDLSQELNPFTLWLLTFQKVNFCLKNFLK